MRATFRFAIFSRRLCNRFADLRGPAADRLQTGRGPLADLLADPPGLGRNVDLSARGRCKCRL